MSLQSLIGIRLEQITPAKETVTRLLNGADRHIADAKVQAISGETRFASAYTAIRMLVDIGLHVDGYWTLTSKPGHHQTAIQTLLTTLGIDSQTVSRLGNLRKQRNPTKFTGDLIRESAVRECLLQAESLRAFGQNWLKVKSPISCEPGAAPFVVSDLRWEK